MTKDLHQPYDAPFLLIFVIKVMEVFGSGDKCPLVHVIQATKSKRAAQCAGRHYVANQTGAPKRSAARCPTATHAGTGHHSCNLRSRIGCSVKSAIDAP